MFTKILLSLLIVLLPICAEASLKYRISKTFENFAESADQSLDRGQANLSDAGITALVKSKLINDPIVRATDIDVDTVNKVVYLNGRVTSQRALNRAIAKTREVKGVKKIVNRLQINGH